METWKYNENTMRNHEMPVDVWCSCVCRSGNSLHPTPQAQTHHLRLLSTNAITIEHTSFVAKETLESEATSPAAHKAVCLQDPRHPKNHYKMIQTCNGQPNGHIDKRKKTRKCENVIYK